MEVPEQIECVDCGQRAFRLTPEPEEGWESGDIVAYRCRGCLDRWDLVVGDDSEGIGSDDGHAFDLRAFLRDRESGKDPAARDGRSLSD